ncbi:MAG: AAA family ATPase [Pirellulales bacterium]|nr:AAA family ATPase [Pirellulales bacterium]
MLESIEFHNFRVLRDTTLPLGPCTILVGANGTGKSTVLQALVVARDIVKRNVAEASHDFVSLASRDQGNTIVGLTLHWGGNQHGDYTHLNWDPSRGHTEKGSKSLKAWHFKSFISDGNEVRSQEDFSYTIGQIKLFSFSAPAIATPSHVQETVSLGPDGAGLATVLDALRDDSPDRFSAIEQKLQNWLPEFDRILFDRPSQGVKSLSLQRAGTQQKVPATGLSDGTLIVLALLTLAYLPEPPSIVCLEEPDRGIHPRLLRCVQDAIYRLCYPKECGEDREPVQVIATTHSPYFVDLFKDHPEEIVVANRVGDNVEFKRVSEQPNIQEILGDTPLGEAWFSGVLGGVPTES